jgi:hypothetical protein
MDPYAGPWITDIGTFCVIGVNGLLVFNLPMLDQSKFGFDSSCSVGKDTAPPSAYARGCSEAATMVFLRASIIILA